MGREGSRGTNGWVGRQMNNRWVVGSGPQDEKRVENMPLMNPESNMWKT